MTNLSKAGVKEVVLLGNTHTYHHNTINITYIFVHDLGQNVNGYHDICDASVALYPTSVYKTAVGFNTNFPTRKRNTPGARFADLLESIADINPEMRIRFTSPHPKDFPEEVLNVINLKKNICASLHLPIQSGIV